MGENKRFTVAEDRLGRVLIGFLALGLLALLAAGLAALWASARNQEHAGWVAHTYQVEIAISDARRLIEQAETTRRGYMLAPDNSSFRGAYRTAARQLPVAVTRLERLTEDNPAQQRRLAAAKAQLRVITRLREQTMTLVTRGAVADARAQFVEELGATRMRSVRTVFDAMSVAERTLLAERDGELRRSVLVFYVVLAIAGALLLAVGIASVLLVRNSTRAIAATRDRLRDANEHLEERVAERTSDLSRANDEIQRFAYIVSHDLRSPLVNVMGFTAELEEASGSLRALVDRAEAEAPQLLDPAARDAARTDLPEAIGFIRSSTQKMDRLINAILTLSRQGRRVLTPEPLDLSVIVDGIRDSLAHRLDESGGTIVVEGALPAITSDRLAVEQILSNLVENAVKYAARDRPVQVTVSGGSASARAWIAVADNGRGIDPRDHERVFDLFRRSGTQDQPGEGIGLAHVRALAYRLGGTVELASALGEGATFRLLLPTTFDLREAS